MEKDKSKWGRADFNGLFSRLLCLSHENFCTDFEGNRVELLAEMILTAFDENCEDDLPQHDQLRSFGDGEWSAQDSHAEHNRNAAYGSHDARTEHCLEKFPHTEIVFSLHGAEQCSSHAELEKNS